MLKVAFAKWRNAHFALSVFALIALSVCAAPARAATLDDFLAFGGLLDEDAVIASAAEVTPERYPDADEVLVDDLVREAYRPDGTSLSLDDEYYKILTEAGRRDHESREYGFDVAYGTCIVARAEIIKPDGRRVPVDLARNCAIATDTEQMDSNIYNPDEKTLALSIPGLEIGDLCHILCLRETTKARVPDTWSDINVFESTSPVKGFTYEIVAPAARPLRHVALRDPVEGTFEASEETRPDGGTTHRWRFRDVPQAFPEPNMPPLYTQVQRIVASTAEDWPSISRWYWNLCAPRLAAVTDEMRETVATLVSGASSDDAKIRAVFAWVSQQVRYMGITTEETAPGYEPHDVSTTFNNRYGVCRDKAALLVAMLRLAGLDAYPVLIHAGAKMDPEVPLPYFNHAIAAVALPGGGFQLMDPTDESTRDLLPAYLANRSYLVAHPDGEPLAVSSVPPASEHLVRIATTGELAADGTLLLESSFAFDGVNDGVYRGYFSRIKPEQRRLFFEGIVKRRFPGAELLRLDLLPEDMRDTTQPLSVALECRVRDWPVRGEGADSIDLPLFGGSLGYVNFVIGRTGLQKRRFTLETEVACGVEETASIRLNGAIGAPVAMPDTLDIDDAGIRLLRTVALADDTLSVDRTFMVQVPEITPDQYPRLKQILAESERVARQRPVFEAHAAVSPDIRIVSDNVSVTLVSADEYIIERDTRTEILTYAGLKAHSEYRVGFNPALADFELVSATVENPDGSVRAVQPEELNLMDAPWVADAPRYPPERVFVASLPGVQVGSVLHITTRRSRRGGFFSATLPFQGFEPVTHRGISVRVPRGVPEPKFNDPGASVAFERRQLADGAVELRWTSENVPALSPEDSCPPADTFMPVLSVSCGDWTEYAARVYAALDDAASGEGCERARSLARELSEAESAPAGKVRAIRDYVARSIRAAGPAFTDLPLGFSAPDTTLADGYGNSADRAVLLVAMLCAAGFEARPLLVRPCDDAPWVANDEEFPAADMFSSVLVEVRGRRGFLGLGSRPALADGVDPDTPILLNDTDQYANLGDSANDRSRALRPEGSRSVIELPREHQARDTSFCVIDLDADGTATISVTNEYFGIAGAATRKMFAEMTPEERDRHYQEMIGALSELALPLTPLACESEGLSTRVSFSAVATNYAARVGSTLSLLLPMGEMRIANLRADTRDLPLLCGGYIENCDEVRVVLPAGVKTVASRPESVKWTLPRGLGGMDFAVDEIARDDGRRELRFRNVLTRLPTIIPPEEYPALLEMNRRLGHPRQRTLILAF